MIKGMYQPAELLFELDFFPPDDTFLYWSCPIFHEDTQNYIRNIRLIPLGYLQFMPLYTGFASHADPLRMQ